jgi:hypothetical protein
LANRADIAHHYSFFNPQQGPSRFSSHDANGFIRLGIFSNTARSVEKPADVLSASREMLSCLGNVLSATVMFVLQRMMKQTQKGQRGCGISFGPGLTVEIMQFHAI